MLIFISIQPNNIRSSRWVEKSVNFYQESLIFLEIWVAIVHMHLWIYLRWAVYNEHASIGHIFVSVCQSICPSVCFSVRNKNCCRIFISKYSSQILGILTKCMFKHVIWDPSLYQSELTSCWMMTLFMSNLKSFSKISTQLLIAIVWDFNTLFVKACLWWDL